MMKEHRLIHRTLEDYDNVRYNSRTAEANDAQQIAQRQAQLAAGGKDVAPVAKVATNPQLAAAQNVYQNQAQGMGSRLDTATGQITSVPQKGVIEQTRDARLAGDNKLGIVATPEQRAQNQQNLKGIMNASKADQIEAQLRSQGIADPITIANAKAAAITEETAQMQKDQASKEISNKNAAANASSNAAAGTAANESAAPSAPPAPTTPQDAGLSAAIAGLPPEYAFLGPVLQAQQAEFAKAQADQQALYEKTTGTTDAAYDAIDKRIDGVESSYKAGTEAIQGLLSQVKEQQSKNIDEQEKAAKDRLAWSELQQSREIERNKVKAVDSKVASLALRGGFGSGAGLSEIEETTRSYENALDDLRSEYGVQRTELGAKFTALHNQVFSDYATNSINNIKDMLSSVERIGQQKNASTEARAKAENDALTTLITNQGNIRKEAAKGLTDGIKDITGLILNEKNIKRQSEQDAWSQLEWFASTYGTNTPKAAIDALSAKLPGVDVASLLASPTLEEIKSRKSASGGGGFSFDMSQIKSTGEPLSFDEFLRTKEQQAIDSGAFSFDTSPSAMAKYKAEYDAKVSTHSQYNPDQIMLRLQDRIKNSAKNVRENALDTVTNYIKQGNFAEADRYVDGLGSPLSATERGDYIQALNAKGNVQRIFALIDQLGAQGPVIGRVRQANPYDDTVVQLDNLITQTVPGLARGIFKEVGVLTDEDIARYRSTIANPTLTYEQARTATRQLLDTIDSSIQNQLAVHQDSGLNIRDIKDRFSRAPNEPIPTSTADSDYVRSLEL